MYTYGSIGIFIIILMRIMLRFRRWMEWEERVRSDGAQAGASLDITYIDTQKLNRKKVPVMNHATTLFSLTTTSASVLLYQWSCGRLGRMIRCAQSGVHPCTPRCTLLADDVSICQAEIADACACARLCRSACSSLLHSCIMNLCDA